MKINELNLAVVAEIETERLLLRRFREDDAGAVYRNWESIPEVAEFMLWDVSISEQETSERLGALISGYETDKLNYTWAIVPKDTDEPVGSVILGWIDEYHHSAELVYMLSPCVRRMGYMTEAVTAVLQYGFETIGLNRIQADCYLRNIASARVMEKCGMRYEGLMRDLYLGKKGFENLFVYAITYKDWKIMKLLKGLI